MLLAACKPGAGRSRSLKQKVAAPSGNVAASARARWRRPGRKCRLLRHRHGSCVTRVRWRCATALRAWSEIATQRGGHRLSSEGRSRDILFGPDKRATGVRTAEADGRTVSPSRRPAPPPTVVRLAGALRGAGSHGGRRQGGRPLQKRRFISTQARSSPRQHRFDIVGKLRVKPLIGRDAEMPEIYERTGHGNVGERQTVLHPDIRSPGSRSPDNRGSAEFLAFRLGRDRLVPGHAQKARPDDRLKTSARRSPSGSCRRTRHTRSSAARPRLGRDEVGLRWSASRSDDRAGIGQAIIAAGRAAARVAKPRHLPERARLDEFRAPVAGPGGLKLHIDALLAAKASTLRTNGDKDDP